MSALHATDLSQTDRRNGKSEAAFRTISEVAEDLDVPQHVLRFWESKFTQIRPLKRGGGRRYYRPEDVVLLRRIRDLLYKDGYTIKGVQKLLRDSGGKLTPAEEARVAQPEPVVAPAAEDFVDEDLAPAEGEEDAVLVVARPALVSAVLPQAAPVAQFTRPPAATRDDSALRQAIEGVLAELQDLKKILQQGQK